MSASFVRRIGMAAADGEESGAECACEAAASAGDGGTGGRVEMDLCAVSAAPRRLPLTGGDDRMTLFLLPVVVGASCPLVAPTAVLRVDELLLLCVIPIAAAYSSE